MPGRLSFEGRLERWKFPIEVVTTLAVVLCPYARMLLDSHLRGNRQVLIGAA